MQVSIPHFPHLSAFSTLNLVAGCKGTRGSDFFVHSGHSQTVYTNYHKQTRLFKPALSSNRIKERRKVESAAEPRCRGRLACINTTALATG